MASVYSKVQRLHICLLMEMSDMMNPKDTQYEYFLCFLNNKGLSERMLSGKKYEPIKVFKLMEEKGLLGVGVYKNLEEVLEDSGNINILDHLKQNKLKITELMGEVVRKLQGDLIEKYRHLRRVLMNPMNERDCFQDMDDIYVYGDLMIESKQDKTSPIVVTSYKQILLNERGSRLTRVFLRGKGGIGKTTFCRKVLCAWCNAHQGRAVGQNGPFQDEDILKMIDILFYINLRDVSDDKDDKDVIEVICDTLEFASMRSIIQTLLMFHEDKILFILDGLDEMIKKVGSIENVVNRKDYPNCCFLVSSRPWKISQMELQVGTQIDLLFDLPGFSERNAMRFAENIFRNCYKDGNAIEQFKMEINQNKAARNLIQVPLLLLFLTHCWYEKKSLPGKLHELYISFLNMSANRLEDKYKKDPNHIHMNLELGDTHLELPRKLSESTLVMKFGEHFLFSLCGVARNFLLSKEKENSLVFERTKLLNALGKNGEEILDLSLKLGLLSVTDSMSFLNRKLSVSFLHKTVQEFLTALYFIFKPVEDLDNFISSMQNFNDVQQHENIFVFLVGLMPEHTNHVLEKVNEMVLVKGKEWFKKGSLGELSNISSIYLRCKEEVIGEDVLLNISCLCMMYKSLDLHGINPAFLQMLVLTHIKFPDDIADLTGLTGLEFLDLDSLDGEIYLPKSHVLSNLSVKNVSLSIMDSNIIRNYAKLDTLKICSAHVHFLLDLSNMVELITLNMSNLFLSSECCDILGSTMRNCTKLQILKIDIMNLHNCMLDLSKMTELTELAMSQVTLSSDCCDVLGRTLTQCTKLSTLNLSNINLHSCILDLSKMAKLKKLDMSCVTLSSNCCDVLGSTMTTCTKLTTLEINNVNLHNCILDLSKMTELTELDISYVTCCDVLGSKQTYKDEIYSVPLRKPTICIISMVTLTSRGFDFLLSSLKDWSKLMTLKIHNTNLHNCMLDLSNVTEITELDMSYVTLSSDCCDVLGRTLTQCTKMVILEIDNINLHNCMLDLSKMTELKRLVMSRVTLSIDCCDLLGRKMGNCTKLTTLEINNMNLHNCILDLSKLSELITLDISCVALFSDCCDIIGRTLTKCTKLSRLSISCINLHNCVLDFSTMTELKMLDTYRVTMSSDCCDVLGSTLTQCTELNILYIDNMNLHNCMLDLSKMTELTHLDMSCVTCCDVLGSTQKHNIKIGRLLPDILSKQRFIMSRVTLSSRGFDFLLSTLKDCHKLMTLEIHDTNLHNCKLDLSKMTELTGLDMSHVTLSSDCCDIIGGTLTQCTKLSQLNISNINLHNCMLDFSTMTELKELYMSRVTLSSDCCDVLGSTLTRCTKLMTLEINNMNLHNCMLDLSKMTKLTELDMSYVTCCDVLGSTQTHNDEIDRLRPLHLRNYTTSIVMSRATLSSRGFDFLLCTLKGCSKLMTLKIHNTNLHNCMLDLSKMTELKKLVMSQVTLSSECCDVLGRTLTQCTKLMTLEINNMNPHNCMLDLSKMTELKEMDMNYVTCCDVLGSTQKHNDEIDRLRPVLSNHFDLMFAMNKQTSFSISKVTLSSRGFDFLLSSLKDCSKFMTLKIHNTNLHNCMLDLTKMTELEKLDMSCVTLSSDCCDILGRTLTQCTKLKILKIEKINLHNCMLDLSKSKMTELTKLDMSYKDLCCHVSGSKEIIKNFSRADEIDRLRLRFLRNYTTSIVMSRVTLSRGGFDFLFSSLKDCSKLMTLKIHNTNLHNCMLDFSTMTELEKLVMSRVALSSECCDVLGRTLTQCTKLKMLKISNMNLHNCLLDLSKLTQLAYLYMSRVTLSSDCCKVLGRTLTCCTKLKTLKICNTNLHSSMLNLFNRT